MMDVTHVNIISKFGNNKITIIIEHTMYSQQ